MKRTLTIIMALALLVSMGTVALANNTGDATITLTERDNDVIVYPPPCCGEDPCDCFWGQFEGEGELRFGSHYLSPLTQVIDSEDDSYLLIGASGALVAPVNRNVVVSISNFICQTNSIAVTNAFTMDLIPNRQATQGDGTINFLTPSLSPGLLPATLISLTGIRVYDAAADYSGLLTLPSAGVVAASPNAVATLTITIVPQV